MKYSINEFEESNSLPSLVILPDASSNDYEYHTRLKNMGVDVLVLDHHEADYESEDAIVINNQLSENYENKALTGAGVVWQFCRYFDERVGQNGTSYKYIDLAALGISESFSVNKSNSSLKSLAFPPPDSTLLTWPFISASLLRIEFTSLASTSIF